MNYKLPAGIWPFKRQLAGIVITLVMLLSGFVLPAEAAAPDRRLLGATGTTWQYTALGDSIAAGLWAIQGYVPRYRSYTQSDTGNTIVLTNLAVSGWTSSDLLNALQTDPAYTGAVHNAQIITLDIGGNDFIDARKSYKAKTCGGSDNQDCLRAAIATFDSNWDAILQIILTQRSPNTIIRVMNLYNPYVKVDSGSNTWPNDAGSDFRVFFPYVENINAYIANSANARAIPYADVYTAFNGAKHNVDPSKYGYISFDGLHPNDTGHKKIADLFRALKYAPVP